jgi:signal peptide peptidase SppA
MLERLTNWLRGGSAARLAGPGALRRVANRPLLVLPETARETLSFLMKRNGTSVAAWDHDDDAGPAPIAMDLRYQRKPGKAYHQSGAIAVIPVEGTLVHKYGDLDPSCGMTGYDGIAAKLQSALADPEVQAILLDINSPGGEVDGVSDLAAQIAAASKPVWAIADAMAYSAAYWLASQCDRLYLSDTGGVGSIGVVMMHVDWSKALADEGVAVTLIHAGAHKVDGNPYAPLPEDVRASFQAEVEDLRLKFATAVATGRGLKVEDVLATEAACMNAADAVAGGFADGIASSFDIVQMFLADLNGENEAPSSAAPGALAAAAPQTSLEPSMEIKTGAAAPVDTVAAKAEGATEAKARIKAITGHAEADGRADLASHLAFDTDMSVDAAAAILKAAPKQAKAQGSALGSAMAGVKPPGVDADAAAGGDAPQASKPVDVFGIYAKRREAMNGRVQH